MTTKSALPIEVPATSYVLPAPRRSAPDVIVGEPRTGSALERGTRVARTLGERFLAFAECQQQFLSELRSRLATLDGDIADGARARLKGALGDAVAILDWCDSVQSDLLTESRRAADGLEPLDVVELCAEVAAATAPEGSVQVTGISPPWWGDARVLADAVTHGLAVVAERTGGIGGRRIEVASAQHGLRIRIAGLGEPGDSLDAGTVRRFRQAVERLGAAVVPDDLGPGGAGLVLVIAKAPAEPAAD